MPSIAAARQAYAYYTTAPKLYRPNVYFDKRAEDGKVGAEAKAKELTEKGPYKVEIVYVDYASNTPRAVQAARSMLSTPRPKRPIALQRVSCRSSSPGSLA